MNEYIKIIIVASILILATWCKFRKYNFEYKNGYDRKCNRCGQRQFYVVDHSFKESHPVKKWIVMGFTKDANCWCHDHIGINKHGH